MAESVKLESAAHTQNTKYTNLNKKEVAFSLFHKKVWNGGLTAVMDQGIFRFSLPPPQCWFPPSKSLPYPKRVLELQSLEGI